MEAARILLARAEGLRGYWAKVEAMDANRASKDRAWAARQGWASEYDDPNLTVRASEIEAICHQLLEEQPAVDPNADQLEMFGAQS